MSRDSRLPTITSDIPSDLRALTNELRRALTQPSGYKAWPNHRLPHVSSSIPDDLRELISRIREELLRPVPYKCVPRWRELEFGREWLYPRDTLPRLTSSVEPDVRRFFERAREMMVREAPEICTGEKTCDSPEGVWVTSLMYPLEFIEEMKASSRVMRGQFYQSVWEGLIPTLVPPTGFVEDVYRDIFADKVWDALIPTLLPLAASIEDVRVYGEVAEVMRASGRIAGAELIPGIFADHAPEEMASSALIVSGGLS